jgi:hypothetical protein
MTKPGYLLVALMAILAVAQEASALPLFARQTGMACSACHFQHFPMLNGFGRAFKSAAYTMMGPQEKLEGDGAGLSIPASLNMAVLTTLGYEKSNAAPGASPLKNDGNGIWYVPGNNGELSLFFGGRVSNYAGFLAEAGFKGTANLVSAKLPAFFEVAEGTRGGLVPFTTNVQGASYGFELLNTGANAVHQMSAVGGFNGAHSSAISAQQFIGTGSAATGLAFVVSSPMGFINLTKFNQLGSGNLTGNSNTSSSGSAMGAGLDSTYLRLAVTFDLAGWDSAVGIQNWSGSSVNATGMPAVPPTYNEMATRATAIDGQMQGELNKMPVGIYASYATAPSVSGATNTYNPGMLTRNSINLSAEIGVLPGRATLGAALRFADSGSADSGGENESDNAIMLNVTYLLAQNMMLSLSYTTASGSYWTDNSNANADKIGSKTTTINLFTLF